MSEELRKDKTGHTDCVSEDFGKAKTGHTDYVSEYFRKAKTGDTDYVSEDFRKSRQDTQNIFLKTLESQDRTHRLYFRRL